MITATQIEELRPAIERTWMMIYPDVNHTYMEDNECRMEMVLDSDRLHFAGFTAENSIVRHYCMEHGWQQVRKQISDHIQLPS